MILHLSRPPAHQDVQFKILFSKFPFLSCWIIDGFRATNALLAEFRVVKNLSIPSFSCLQEWSALVSMMTSLDLFLDLLLWFRPCWHPPTMRSYSLNFAQHQNGAAGDLLKTRQASYRNKSSVGGYDFLGVHSTSLCVLFVHTCFVTRKNRNVKSQIVLQQFFTGIRPINVVCSLRSL